MNKLIYFFTVLFFLNNCSFNESSSLWKNKKNNLEKNKNITKIFDKKNKTASELNENLKLDFSKLETNNFTLDNKNNLGSQTYKGELNKIGNYKFSKLIDINHLNFTPVFLKDGIVFFDNKGSIIRYNKSQKIVWKKNHYLKNEKKLNPKINIIQHNQNLLVADSIAKYYSINLNTGDINWSKNSNYPFNSEIKIINNKMFVVDYKNVLRCYKIEDGSECWNLSTQDSFTISDTKFSIIIDNDFIIFSNSIGDVTAVDNGTGLIIWQLPTQRSSIINESYDFKVSKLVSDGNSIFFSNNRNEFYSIDLKTGTINWKNEINSNIKPIIIGNLIFTISNQGYLFVIEKAKGNIIRITDLYKIYKEKHRKNLSPEGFVIGNKKLYLTNSDGSMIIVDLSLGNIIKTQKISGSVISEPYIYNNNLYVVKNGSIIQFN